jgi:hypothetical protein
MSKIKKISRRLLSEYLESNMIDQKTFDKLISSGIVTGQSMKKRVMTDSLNRTVYLKGFNFGIKVDGKSTKKNSIIIHWGEHMKECVEEMNKVYEKYSTDPNEIKNK